MNPIEDSLDLEPRKILADIIIMIIAFIMTLLRIKIRCYEEILEIMIDYELHVDAEEHVPEEIQNLMDEIRNNEIDGSGDAREENDYQDQLDQSRIYFDLLLLIGLAYSYFEFSSLFEAYFKFMYTEFQKILLQIEILLFTQAV